MSDVLLYQGSSMTASAPVTWRLAPGYLAAGYANLLVGEEGIGKSLWTIRACAAITTGKSWGPFTIADDPADVVLIATEDGWSDAVRPRLEVAAADLDRVHVLCGSVDGTGAPQFPEDIDKLRGISPAVVVVDAWIDTVPGGFDVKNTQKARRAIQPWKEYAAKTGAAVLLVTHTNRMDSSNTRDKYGLSAALRQVARSTLYALEDPDTAALLVGPEKNNLSVKAFAERFDKTAVPHFESTATNDGTVARLDHLGTDGRSIRDVVAAIHHGSQTSRAPTKSDLIDGWLRGILANGSLASSELEESARVKGYSSDQLKKSRCRLKVRSFKNGDAWFAELPKL